MNSFNKAIYTLEFNKVREKLSAHARTEAAKSALLHLTPSSDPVVVARLTEETSKAKEMVVVKGVPPFSGAKDITALLDRAARGGILSASELLSVASSLKAVASLLKYKGGDCGCLNNYFDLLQENSFLEKRISSAIIGEDMLADDASEALFRIRKESRKTESAIRDILAGYTSGHKSKYLQENIVTIRGGRYVVPVKVEYRNEVKGLLHDTSASGATLFIEPLAVLEANNRLRELKSAEEEEIGRILSELTDEVVRFINQLSLNCKVMTDLACIFARASYSYEIDGCAAIVPKQGKNIKLVKARHPLIDTDKVVPMSIEYGKKEKSLIITGPNTGGKTVTLKTIGLFAIMAQCGLHIPCVYGSELPIFSNVLADIGDEQSIEQSLSTFSAHMVNIASILKEFDENSLVLFDELGAGTDPIEGAALAVAILEYVKNHGAISAATTHYAELKLYALENDDVLNASCEFDVETLKPTYRLITGLPGKSNAFSISSRLGISPEIINAAISIMREDNKKFEDVLSRLEATESQMEKERASLAAEKAAAEKRIAEAEERAKLLEERSEREISRAREQANAILASAKASSEFIFDELRKLQKDKDKADAKERLEKSRADIRNALKDGNADIYKESESDAEKEEYVLPRPLAKGDHVLIADIKTKGIVLSIEGKNAIIQAGIIKTKTPVTNLRLLADEVEIPKNYVKQTTQAPLRESVKNEIDLRGETGDDAWFMVDRYLDSSITAGYSTVTLIHGKGTGALRAALWRYMKGDKRIKSFRSGRYGEGDTGVTIVELTGKHK